MIVYLDASALVKRYVVEAALRAFGQEWASYVRVQMTEVLVARASAVGSNARAHSWHL